MDRDTACRAEEAFRLAFRILAEDHGFRERFLAGIDAARAGLLRRLIGCADLAAPVLETADEDMVARALVALATLPTRQVLAVWLRLAGVRWRTVAWLMGCTWRHAVRLRDRALAAVAWSEEEAA